MHEKYKQIKQKNHLKVSLILFLQTYFDDVNLQKSHKQIPRMYALNNKLTQSILEILTVHKTETDVYFSYFQMFEGQRQQ